MEKALYEQLDRIEYYTQTIAAQQGADLLISIYEEEILDEKGTLHHLTQDQKVQEFFEALKESENADDETPETEDEYENTPFR